MPDTIRPRRRESGYALLTALTATLVLAAMFAAHALLTRSELRGAKASADGVVAFYAAEGGLNLRSARIRQRFVDYNRPSGTSPDPSAPCRSGASGAGDFACERITMGGKNVVTYVLEPRPDGTVGTVGTGETYAGLNYLQYGYTVRSDARGARSDALEARLEMQFQSRLVPLFQFAAFYTDDLEINPSPAMELSGRVHSNRDIYLSPGTGLTLDGRVTSGGRIHRGRKMRALGGLCDPGAVLVRQSPGATSVLQAPCVGSTEVVTNANVARYRGQVQTNVPPLTVPSLASLDPAPAGGNELWTKADLRVVARRVGTNTYAVEVRTPANTLDVASTTNLNVACAGAVGVSVGGNGAGFYDKRERHAMTLLEVDQAALMRCIGAGRLFDAAGAPLALSDTSGNGLVWHFSFDTGDPDVNDASKRVPTNLGVRVRNAETLGAGPGETSIRGLTIATNQAAYLWGHFNRLDKKPAAVLADTINILSTEWDDANIAANPNATPPAGDTVVNAAFLSGTDVSRPGEYNGGLENYPRFHEDWRGARCAGGLCTFRYRGSFVSLGEPSHARGAWNQTVYYPPRRDWNYDADFDDAANLPPLTPRFVYLRQLLFAREYR